MEITSAALCLEETMPYGSDSGREVYELDVSQVAQLARILGKLEGDVKTLTATLSKLVEKVDAMDKRLTESEIKTKIAAGIVTLAISVVSGVVGYWIGK